jgi:sugar phosphate isomerase/epimerase
VRALLQGSFRIVFIEYAKSRRNMKLRSVVCGVAAFATTFGVLTCAVMPRAQAAPIGVEYRSGGFAIGAQAWSFNKFTAYEAVEKTAQAGGRVIEFFPGQKLSVDDAIGIGPGMSEEAITKLKAHLTKFGVKAVAFGVTGISRDEAGARPLFEWAKKMDIGILNTESTDAIDTIEKMVKEFDIKVGFHNHPRNNDPNYKVWDPNSILSLVKDRDRRVGACADTGHWVRSGIKPVDALRILRGRIVSSHLKDLHEFSGRGHDVPFGTGVSDIKGVLDELRAQNFEGSLSVEYEHNWDNNVPDIAQCIGFVRGYGSGTSKATPIR